MITTADRVLQTERPQMINPSWIELQDTCRPDCNILNRQVRVQLERNLAFLEWPSRSPRQEFCHTLDCCL
jgi:hypothetical protein